MTTLHQSRAAPQRKPFAVTRANSKMELFSNFRTKIYYWHLLVALIIVKYFVLSAIHLHQYFYVSGSTVPADLSKHLTQALWDSNKTEFTSELNDVISATFFSSAAHLVLIGFNVLPVSWSWFKEKCLKSPKWAMVKAVIFFTLFKSAGQIFDFLREDFAGYEVDIDISVFIDIALRAVMFGACLHFSSKKSRMWTLFSLFMVSYIAYDVIYTFFYWPTYKIPNTLIKIPDFLGKVKEIAARIGFPTDRMYIDSVFKGNRDNVCTMGIGQLGVVLFGDRALKTLNVSGSVGVVSHELGHWYYNHLIFTFLTESLYMVTRNAATLAFITNPVFYKSFGFPIDLSSSDLPFGVGLIISDVLADEITELFMPLSNMVSWFKEYQADGFSVRLGQARNLYVGLIRLLSREAESVCTLPYGLMYSSHPIFSRRMANLAKLF